MSTQPKIVERPFTIIIFYIYFDIIGAEYYHVVHMSYCFNMVVILFVYIRNILCLLALL